MEIEEIKEKMKSYRDFFGGDILDISEVDQAKTKGELRNIIDRHEQHLEMQCCDAVRHLDRFTEGLFLTTP